MPSDGELLGRVRLVAFDVDGTLTDGRILMDGDGTDRVAFHVRDGLGIRLLADAGVAVAFLSGRKTEVVAARARVLGLQHALAGVRNKAEELSRIAREVGVDLSETAFVGDDVQDLPAFAAAGTTVAVADAVPEVRAAADLVLEARGGAGAARELAERLLRAQGKWGDAIARYTHPEGTS